MSDYTNKLIADVKAKNPAEPEFHQAVEEVVWIIGYCSSKAPGIYGK